MSAAPCYRVLMAACSLLPALCAGQTPAAMQAMMAGQGAMTFYAVEPTTGTTNAATGVVTSTGQFRATLQPGSGTNRHLFPGTAATGRDAAGSIAGRNGNGLRVLIDTASLGGAPVDVAVGQTVTCTRNVGAGAAEGIGIADDTQGYPRILIVRTATCTVAGAAPTPVFAAVEPGRFKVGTLDLHTFGGIAAPALRTALAKAALVVTDVFASPDIFALQGTGGRDALGSVADAVNAATAGTTAYMAMVSGNDAGSSGFLVNTATVRNANYFEAGRDATYVASTGAAALWEQPPLVLQCDFARTGRNYSVTVLNVHMALLDTMGDRAPLPDVRTRRAAQAVAIRALVQQYGAGGANVIVAGNLNAPGYNDGDADVADIIRGSPASLTDFTLSVPADTRYNAIEQGYAATFEHILTTGAGTAPLASYVVTVTQPHFSADYAAAAGANDPATPSGLTPHDGFLVSFAIPPVATTATLGPPALGFGAVSIGDSGAQPLTFTNTTAVAGVVNVRSIAVSGANAAEFLETDNCTALAANAACTINVTFAPRAKGARSATITVTSDSTVNPALSATLAGNGLDTTASLSPTSADFGSQTLNTGTAAKVFTWTNTSAVPLAIASVDATGDFSISSTTCTGRIAANGTCAVSVVFTPVATRARTGTLTVSSAASLNGTLAASLTGIGFADAAASADSLSFGIVDVGSASAAQTVTISNNTAAAIALTGLAVGGDFRQAATTCGPALAGHANCTVALAFTPVAVGQRLGSLTVTTNDAKAAVLNVALTGYGVDFSVTASPASGTVVAGLGVSAMATVTPLGGFNAAIAMSCTTVATGTACAFATANFTPGAATADHLTISTASRYTVIGYGSLLSPRGRLLALLLSLGGLGFLLRARRQARRTARLLLACASLALAAGALSGCGSKTPAQNSPYTAPGTYDILITATDGTVTRTAAYALTVTAK